MFKFQVASKWNINTASCCFKNKVLLQYYDSVITVLLQCYHSAVTVLLQCYDSVITVL